MLRGLLKRVLYPNNYSSESYVNYLKKMGADIGKNVMFFDPINTFVDATRPYLLSIGDYCKITRGVVILTHDYSRSVLRMKYKEILGEAANTKIGKNVFIGMNCIILMGTNIGDNVIIGAGSIVTHDIPGDVVAAGNPARVIMTLDEYYNKRKKRSEQEAKEYAQLIFKKTGRKPTIQELGSFFPLYLKRDLSEIKRNKLRINLSGDDYNDILKYFFNSEPVYRDFDDFLNNCFL